jgi:hypothetical protein
VIRRLVPIIGAVVLVAGCAAVPTRVRPSPLGRPVAGPPASPVASTSVAGHEWLIALVGTVGSMELVSANADGRLAAGTGSAVPPNAAWLSSDGSTFVLTTLDGRTLVGSPTHLAPAPGDLGEPHPARAFGSIEAPSTAGSSSSGGRRLAFVEGDPGSGLPGRITVVMLVGRKVRTATLPRPAEGPPGWLPDGRLAVVSRDQADRPVTLLVDPGTGRIATINGPPLRSIATAANVVVTVDAEGTARAGGVTPWLAGADLPAVPGLPGGPILMAQPSPDGRELAVVLADANGDAASIRILAIGAPGREIARFELPHGANRAVVSWLAVQ